MELKNMFQLKTKSGHLSIDAVKSGIQKYARRGMHVEMLQAVSEMDAFKLFEKSDNITIKRASKAIRTNMINHLKVILFEEVSFSQVNAFVTTVEKIKEWEDENRVDESTLAEIVAIIAYAKKLRIPSYLRASYGGNGNTCMLDKKAFLDGIDNQNIDCIEWIYHNDEEALQMLTDLQFPGKEHILPLIKAEWKRLKPTKSKVGSNERFSFVVIPWLWIMYDDDLNERDGVEDLSFSKKNIKEAYMKTDVQFEDYVYDKHTKEGKKRGKTEEDHEVIVNEDTVWLSHFEEFKNNYNNQPDEVKVKKLHKPKEMKTKRLRRGTVQTDTIKEIDICVDDIKFLDDVRANKLPCGYLSIKGKDKIIKPMTKGLNYGIDYLYVDKQKRLFGLKELDIKLRKIPGKKLTKKITKKLTKDDQDIKTINSYEWEDNEEGQIIAIMNRINVKTDLGKFKSLLKDEAKYREMLKIRLFNGFFRTSDNTLRNILVDEDDELWVIDENDIYGKRKNVFNKKESVKNSEFLTIDMIESVIDELDFATHEQILIDEMSKYFPRASCEYYEHELRERVRNYKQIVLKELGLSDQEE